MSTYAVGDIQGCLSPLKDLLAQVAFNPDRDMLWVAGDLVNRGPESLETLRFIYNLRHCTKIVLGNHDLHLLASHAGYKKLSSKDTLQEILEAPDRDQLLKWLIHQPLIQHDAKLGFTMTHAGIPPIWTLKQALSYAEEVHTVLRGPAPETFFAEMYGNKPAGWKKSLKGMERLRVITNYFTRMRFCDAQGGLEFDSKEDPHQAPSGYQPWFNYPQHLCRQHKLIFGHWAALMGNTQHPSFTGLDTGCVWGGCLTLMRLDDQTFYKTECLEQR